MGLGANAMYVLNPRLNTFLSVQLGWGCSVALGVWTCYGITGQSTVSEVTTCSAVIIQWDLTLNCNKIDFQSKEDYPYTNRKHRHACHYIVCLHASPRDIRWW